MNNDYELIGTTTIDLSGYATEQWVGQNYLNKQVSETGDYEESHTGSLSLRVNQVEDQPKNALFELSLDNEDVDESDRHYLTSILAENKGISLISKEDYFGDMVYGKLSITRGTVRLSTHSDVSGYDSYLNLSDSELSSSVADCTLSFGESGLSVDLIASRITISPDLRYDGPFGEIITGSSHIGNAELTLGVVNATPVSGIDAAIFLTNYGGEQSDESVVNVNADIFKHNGNKILDASNTSANPTLSGNENQLTSLKLNGTDYKVGSNLYWNCVSISTQNSGGCTFVIPSTSALTINNYTSLFNALPDEVNISASGNLKSVTRWIRKQSINNHIRVNGSDGNADITSSTTYTITSQSFLV